MSFQDKLTTVRQRLVEWSQAGYKSTKLGLRRHWIGLTIITVATLVFFAPILTKVSSYSEGGDAMFNAWTLSRNHHCILQQGCPDYTDGNIYFPNEDSMLYSETQLSAGLLTLPLYAINKNPVFAYNMWTLLSFLFSGIFMYLLAKYLSKNNEPISIFAGLLFEFAPLKMAAFGHLQNLSIFWLPLIILLFLRYLSHKKSRKRYILGALLAMVMLFYASWYQMVFALLCIGPFLLGLLISKIYPTKRVLLLGLVTGIAIISTLPLATEYVRFSKTNSANFSLYEQAFFSSSLKDYLIPNFSTLEGQVYYRLRPMSQMNSYNPDSYSYHGLAVTLACFAIVIATLTRRGKRRLDKKNRRLIQVFAGVGLVGFITSLGPLLKVGKSFAYSAPGITEHAVIPLPYILVSKYLPQLSFIRALGRASVILLFVLCCILAIGSLYLAKVEYRKRMLIIGAFIIIAAFEVLPFRPYPASTSAHTQNKVVPAVYEYVKSQPEINNIVVLRADPDYPTALIPVARAEDVLWAGFHNRNIFNGYSGYEPKNYGPTYIDFVNFQPDDVPKLQKLGLRYVLVDKQLSQANPQLRDTVAEILPQNIYEDDRYALFKIEP